MKIAPEIEFSDAYWARVSVVGEKHLSRENCRRSLILFILSAAIENVDGMAVQVVIIDHAP